MVWFFHHICFVCGVSNFPSARDAWWESNPDTTKRLMGVQSGYVTSCIQENIILWPGREEKIGASESSLPAADDQAASTGDCHGHRRHRPRLRPRTGVIDLVCPAIRDFLHRIKDSRCTTGRTIDGASLAAFVPTLCRYSAVCRFARSRPGDEAGQGLEAWGFQWLKVQDWTGDWWCFSRRARANSLSLPPPLRSVLSFWSRGPIKNSRCETGPVIDGASLSALVPTACRCRRRSAVSCRSARSQWYVHFALLFCIIIYCYLLIYFIFRDDTYVISSIFTCLMIIGELATGVRILL
jgi:hypothetical protein